MRKTINKCDISNVEMNQWCARAVQSQLWPGVQSHICPPPPLPSTATNGRPRDTMSNNLQYCKLAPNRYERHEFKFSTQVKIYYPNMLCTNTVTIYSSLELVRAYPRAEQKYSLLELGQAYPRVGHHIPNCQLSE